MCIYTTRNESCPVLRSLLARKRQTYCLQSRQSGPMRQRSRARRTRGSTARARAGVRGARDVRSSVDSRAVFSPAAACSKRCAADACPASGRYRAALLHLRPAQWRRLGGLTAGAMRSCRARTEAQGAKAATGCQGRVRTRRRRAGAIACMAPSTVRVAMAALVLRDAAHSATMPRRNAAGGKGAHSARRGAPGRLRSQQLRQRCDSP